LINRIDRICAKVLRQIDTYVGQFAVLLRRFFVFYAVWRVFLATRIAIYCGKQRDDHAPLTYSIGLGQNAKCRRASAKRHASVAFFCFLCGLTRFSCYSNRFLLRSTRDDQLLTAELGPNEMRALNPMF
jgi:hypothetical protein